MNRRITNESGFTLLEVLVSVSLLAMLLLVGYGAIRTATHSVKSGEALIARSEELRTAHTFLRRQLAGMMAIPYETDPRTGASFRFDGASDYLRFVAPMPGYLSRGGPHVQQLVLASERGGLRLEFNHSQLNGFESDATVGGEREPVVLVAGMEEAVFEYRAREADGQLGEWSETWDDPQLLPQLVRLRVRFPEGDPREWPELEVPVIASATPNFAVSGAPGSGPRPPRRPAPRPDH